MAEGKELAVCIGLMKLSTQDMYDIVLSSSHACCIMILISLSLSLSLSLSPSPSLFLSTSINKGIGVESIHYLGDGLWRMKEHI